LLDDIANLKAMLQAMSIGEMAAHLVISCVHQTRINCCQ
jgi:hypothetical protein